MEKISNYPEPNSPESFQSDKEPGQSNSETSSDEKSVYIEDQNSQEIIEENSPEPENPSKKEKNEFFEPNQSVFETKNEGDLPEHKENFEPGFSMAKNLPNASIYTRMYKINGEYKGQEEEEGARVYKRIDLYSARMNRNSESSSKGSSENEENLEEATETKERETLEEDESKEMAMVQSKKEPSFKKEEKILEMGIYRNKNEGQKGFGKTTYSFLNQKRLLGSPKPKEKENKYLFLPKNGNFGAKNALSPSHMSPIHKFLNNTGLKTTKPLKNIRQV